MTNQNKDNLQDRKETGFNGKLNNIQLSDIIRMCCPAGSNLMIHVTNTDQEGTIYIYNGDIVIQQQKMAERIHRAANVQVHRFQRKRYPELPLKDGAAIDEKIVSKFLAPSKRRISI